MIKEPSTQIAIGTIPVLILLNHVNAVVGTIAGVAALIFLITRIRNNLIDARVKKAELEKLYRELGKTS